MKRKRNEPVAMYFSNKRKTKYMGMSDSNYNSVPLSDTNHLTELIKFDKSRMGKMDKHAHRLQKIVD